jgi:lysophospholipase L1-like esterase
VFGDSVNHAAAPFVQAELDRRFGAGAVLVRNRAVPGSTSEQLVSGTDGLNAPWPASVAADVVLVNHGINDAYAPLGIAPERYRANMLALASGPAVVALQTSSPTTAAVYDTAANAATVRDIAAQVRTPLADVQAYVLGLPNWQGHMPDGIHPNAVLHAMIARDVTVPAIAPLVERLRCL